MINTFEAPSLFFSPFELYMECSVSVTLLVPLEKVIKVMKRLIHLCVCCSGGGGRLQRHQWRRTLTWLSRKLSVKLIFQLSVNHTHTDAPINFWFIYFWLHACFNMNLVLESVYLAQVIISSLVQDERYWLVRFVANCFSILKSAHGSAHHAQILRVIGFKSNGSKLIRLFFLSV